MYDGLHICMSQKMHEWFFDYSCDIAEDIPKKGKHVMFLSNL